MRSICFAASILVAGICHQASALTIYDNTVNDLSMRFDPGASEVGDEIILAGTERNLIEFSFEYWGTAGGDDMAATFFGTVSAQVKFYINDGPLASGAATPGTVFYDSGSFAVPTPTPRSTFVFSAGSDFPAGGLLIPVDRMTWSVQFTSSDTRDDAGLDLYSLPVVGQNFPDYWFKDLISGDWSLRQSPGASPPIDFAARFTVPDATGASISFMSLLSLLGFGYLVRRKRSSALAL